MLKTQDLRSGYSGVDVLHGIDLEMTGGILAVLGANGAGKTTLMKAIARVVPLTGGELYFDSKVVTAWPSYRLALAGLALVPQENNVFPDLTVEENLSIGAMGDTEGRKARFDEVYETFPAVFERRSQKAGTLSGGESQMVAVGRALMQRPSLLLLDEPSAGLAPMYVESLFSKIQSIHKTTGIGIIVAEQNASKALEVAQQVLVLNLGRVALFSADVASLDMKAIREGYGL